MKFIFKQSTKRCCKFVITRLLRFETLIFYFTLMHKYFKIIRIRSCFLFSRKGNRRHPTWLHVCQKNKEEERKYMHVHTLIHRDKNIFLVRHLNIDFDINVIFKFYEYDNIFKYMFVYQHLLSLRA